MGLLERIAEIEAEIFRTQKNKKTEYHIGCLKARIAKLRREVYAPTKTQNVSSFEVKRAGDVRCVMIGHPSVGKSSLVSVLTETEQLIRDHAFSTVKCAAGRFTHKCVDVQVVDLPGILDCTEIGKGRQSASVSRTADVVILCIDITDRAQTEIKHQNMFGGLQNEAIDKNVNAIANSELIRSTDAKNEISSIINTSPDNSRSYRTNNSHAQSIFENSKIPTCRSQNKSNIACQTEKTLLKELRTVGVRPGVSKPKIRIFKKATGGITMNISKGLEVSKEAAEGALKELGLVHCEVFIDEACTIEEIVEAGVGTTVYPKMIKVYTKIDLIDIKTLRKISEDENYVFTTSASQKSSDTESTNLPQNNTEEGDSYDIKKEYVVDSSTPVDNPCVKTVFVSVKRKWGLDELKDMLVEAAELTRIYTKKKGEDPLLDKPIILRGIATVENACEKLHKDFKMKFKHAKVWGTSTKHQPQKVGLNHILHDEDVIEIHT